MPLILPPSISRSREDGHGKVFQCGCCGAKFPLAHDQLTKFARHVRQCSERHDGEIQAQVAKRQRTVFNQPADVERWRHFREGGKS